MTDVTQLIQARDKAASKLKRLEAQLISARKEHDELDTAVRVIQRFSGVQVDHVAHTHTQNDNGQLIFGFVGIGQKNALFPREIIDSMKASGHDIGDDLIRTQLWRMAKRGELQKVNGRYWRPVPADVQPEVADEDGWNTDSVNDSGWGPSNDWQSHPSPFDNDFDDSVPF